MHETGIVRDFVRQLEQVASDSGAEAVSGVEVWLGALSQFTPHHFREHFEDESKGTIAEGAKLDIHASEDAADPNALYVMIRSVDLEIQVT